MNTEITVLHFEKSRIPHTRYMAGCYTFRNMIVPIWDGGRVVGTQELIGKQVKVFHVLGFGETEEDAMLMAEIITARRQRDKQQDQQPSPEKINQPPSNAAHVESLHQNENSH